MRALALALIASSTALSAQMRGEGTVEYVRAADHRVEAGAGVVGRVGTYVRGSLRVSADAWSSDSANTQVRVEGALRFLLDPLGEVPWGMSLGAGLGYRRRPYLVTVFELEGPRRAGMRPALQVALGSGTRVGLVIRRAAASGR